MTEIWEPSCERRACAAVHLNRDDGFMAWVFIICDDKNNGIEYLDHETSRSVVDLGSLDSVTYSKFLRKYETSS